MAPVATKEGDILYIWLVPIKVARSLGIWGTADQIATTKYGGGGKTWAWKVIRHVKREGKTPCLAGHIQARMTKG